MDAAGFELFYADALPKAVRIAETIVGWGSGRADDVAQESFVKLLQRWEELADWSPGRRMAWLAAVVRNAAIDVLRRIFTQISGHRTHGTLGRISRVSAAMSSTRFLSLSSSPCFQTDIDRRDPLPLPRGTLAGGVRRPARAALWIVPQPAHGGSAERWRSCRESRRPSRTRISQPGGSCGGHQEGRLLGARCPTATEEWYRAACQARHDPGWPTVGMLETRAQLDQAIRWVAESRGANTAAAVVVDALAAVGNSRAAEAVRDPVAWETDTPRSAVPLIDEWEWVSAPGTRHGECLGVGYVDAPWSRAFVNRLVVATRSGLQRSGVTVVSPPADEGDWRSRRSSPSGHGVARRSSGNCAARGPSGIADPHQHRRLSPSVPRRVLDFLI